MATSHTLGDDLLSVRQAAVLIGKDRSTVMEAVRLGQLPSIQLGKRSYILRGPLLRMLERSDDLTPETRPPAVAGDSGGLDETDNGQVYGSRPAAPGP